VARKISGSSVALTAAGGVLVWSGWKGATLAATFKALLNGNLNAPATETVSGVGTAASSASATSGTASANYLTIANYLISNGYGKAAAAGIAGCIAGESGGNPEAVEAGGGGGGLIQWTPWQQYGIPITGHASADLEAQLPLIIAYNNAQGPNLVAMLNQIADPVQAADFYSQYFERPAVADSDVRAGVAQSVYAQLQAEKGSA
jgi:hypothetical protein